MRKRKESGLSIKTFCENEGFHENIYYYWQRKLREAACEETRKIQNETTSLAPLGFAEVKLRENPALPQSTVSRQGQMCVEVGRIHMIADGEYPVSKLTDVLREVIRLC
jgi:hypothetical protein